MSDNPYETPESNLQTTNSVDVPAAVLKKIKQGWIAAIISGVLTLIMTSYFVYSAMSGESGGFVDYFDVWNYFDVVLIFILAWGIYKKSRVASTFMFVYFLASKILIYIETGQISANITALIFLYFYLQAMIGTFQYHKLTDGRD